MMTDAVRQVIDRMLTSPRPVLLTLLAATITQMTILGRGYYDDEDSASHFRQTNETIHRLAGHLCDLCDPDKPFAESRAAAVGHALALLPASSIAHLYRLKA
jgi:hypothetical protein